MIAALVRVLNLLAAGLRRLGRPRAAAVPPPATADETEQQVSAALLAGRIGQAEYRARLEELANADDARRPLEVPPP
ncbi:hypothetical protein [Kitasatospora sp. P5_F3]